MVVSTVSDKMWSNFLEVWSIFISEGTGSLENEISDVTKNDLVVINAIISFFIAVVTFFITDVFNIVCIWAVDAISSLAESFLLKEQDSVVSDLIHLSCKNTWTEVNNHIDDS